MHGGTAGSGRYDAVIDEQIWLEDRFCVIGNAKKLAESTELLKTIKCF